MAEPVALAALAIDAVLGWPQALYARVGHPVGAFARIVGACARRWNGSERSARARRLSGIATVLTLVVLAGGAGVALTLVAAKAGWVVLAAMAWPALAQRSLDTHFGAVVAALQGKDLAQARQAVGMIVGRDTATLEEAGIARAAIESLAESFCDGVVAPLFWLIVAGLPGIWVMKAVNTADSLIGHKEAPWRDFGWAAARLDDAMNFVPARLSALLICLAAPGGWRIGWRYRRAHASPNAGWPEAAMAGALGIRLAGPVRYDGAVADKPWIGEGGEADAPAMAQARRIYHRACALCWALAGGVAWLA
ncbi:cobalamin biosynthesis protein CobD [Sphingobium amiense]|uniref:Cobalamin biosynthesis protein CobD n=1 Tax=Sphingobium amiense TaxID=135719 RepID=A0A494W4M4_9SPHN|nr:adenosylcobinamide-phosphate synthase CbiB [Sphingobium amiense]BBD99171.1 cobalamin biosynthesis protein CobD [Sphingobium amiense]